MNIVSNNVSSFLRFRPGIEGKKILDVIFILWGNLVQPALPQYYCFSSSSLVLVLYGKRAWTTYGCVIISLLPRGKGGM